MVRRFLDQPVWVRVLRAILLAAVIGAFAVLTPTPYSLQAPGRAVPARDLLSIADRKAHAVNGEFLMTTVLSEKATVILCLYALMDSAASLTRTDTESQDGERAQTPNDAGQMELSQHISTMVALEKLGYRVRGEYLGLRILGLTQNSLNLDLLRPGDLIVELAGERLPSLESFKAALAKYSDTKRVPAEIRRNDKQLPVELRLNRWQGRWRIGAVLRPEYDHIPLPVQVSFHDANTSGASAGLVFALQIYDQLNPGDLARGRVIAATGTLDAEGRVGPIQGLSFKLVGAERAGASIFLVPQENWPEIKNISTSMEVIPVGSFQEALDALD